MGEAASVPEVRALSKKVLAFSNIALWMFTNKSDSIRIIEVLFGQYRAFSLREKIWPEIREPSEILIVLSTQLHRSLWAAQPLKYMFESTCIVLR